MRTYVGTTLADAMYNLTPRSGASTDYCRGLVVGVLATMLALGVKHADAYRLMRGALPEGYRIDGIPEVLRHDLTSD